MEEIKNKQTVSGKEKLEQKKLTYEQLNQMAGDLYQRNQQLVSRIQQMQQALDDSEFNRVSFFVSMLFKVVEHPEVYSDDFLKWCVTSIENSLYGFADTFASKEEEGKTSTEGTNVTEHNEA